MHGSTTAVERRAGAGGALGSHDVELYITHDLHDGLLQVLTGISLQVEAIIRLLETDPCEARRRLSLVGTAISDEQRELRLLVDESRADAPPGSGPDEFPERLVGMLQRIGDIWGVDARLISELPELHGLRARAVLRLAQEAVVNAARHGEASSVTVEFAPRPAALVVVVQDDGRGFSFEGHLDHEQLQTLRLGPLSLKRRVLAEGGRLDIDSHPGCTTVRMELPAEASS